MDIKREIEIKNEMVRYLSESYGWTEEEILGAQRFDDLGLDSLSLYSLVEECESKFNIELEINDITDIDSPERFIKYISERINL